ncbi:MAG: hypothetical protein LBE12_14030 [Planctomycetaceae bacterium]|jgi:hypothetical protein|nr:hypothetical protein [Planctomycetaceae bacterium]
MYKDFCYFAQMKYNSSLQRYSRYRLYQIIDRNFLANKNNFVYSRLLRFKKTLLCTTIDCCQWTSTNGDIFLKRTFWQDEWYKNDRLVMTRYLNFRHPIKWFNGIFSEGYIVTDNQQDIPILLGITFLTNLDW